MLKHVFRTRTSLALVLLSCIALDGCFTYSDALLLEASPVEVLPRDAGPEAQAAEAIDATDAAVGVGQEADQLVPDPMDDGASPNIPVDAGVDHEPTASPDAAGADEGPPAVMDAGPAEAGCISGGHALLLGGSTYGTMARVVQDDFTIEAWIKMDHSLTGTFFWEGSAIAFADVSAAAKNDFSFTVLNDKLALGTGNPDTFTKSTSNVAISKWVHVAATRTKATGTFSVFVNGVIEGSATGNTNSLTASSTLQIGGSVGTATGGNRFTGQLDEFRIWSLVRTPAQIITNMHRHLQGNETGLVGYYRFDETTGSTAIDASPSLNPAVFTGPVSWVVSDAPLCD